MNIIPADDSRWWVAKAMWVVVFYSKSAVGLDHRRLAVRDKGSHMADLPALHHDALDKAYQILSSDATFVRLAI